MPNILEEVVDKLGGYDKLNAAEAETYRSHLKIMEGRVLAVTDIKTFVRNMITSIERDLVEAKEGSDKSKNLKARLKNFLFLEQFIFSPEKAREALEKYYKSL